MSKRKLRKKYMWTKDMKNMQTQLWKIKIRIILDLLHEQKLQTGNLIKNGKMLLCRVEGKTDTPSLWGNLVF